MRADQGAVGFAGGTVTCMPPSRAAAAEAPPRSAATNAGTIQFDTPAITAQIGSKDSIEQLARQLGMDWVKQLSGGVLAGLNLAPKGVPTAGAGAQAFGDQLWQNLRAGAARAVINTAVYGGAWRGISSPGY